MNYFAYPEMAVWLLAPATFAFLVWLARRGRLQELRVLGQTSTITRMLPPGVSRRRRWVHGCRGLALLCFVAALAGPLLGSKLVEFKQKGVDLFIAVDCSLSMQAQDLAPNRMAHAKLLLGELIDRMGGSRIGVLAFAGKAHIICPLTVDQTAARETLEAIDIGTVPIPGTAIGEAIRVATRGLKAGESATRTLVLLTDGEDHRSNPLGAAKDAAKLGLKIFTIGIGSPQGEPIPVMDEQGKRTGYKRDKKGEVILSKVDEAMLVKIAQETGGQYFRANSTGDEIEPLTRALQALQNGDQKAQMFNRYENRYQWPLALGLLLLFVSLVIPEMGWKRI